MRHFACAFHRAVCVLAIAVLIWPQIAQALHPDDPLPLRPDQCEREQDNRAKTLCKIKVIVNLTQEVASWVSGISGAIDAATVALEMIGILKKFDQAEEFKKLHEHLDRVAGALDWKIAADARAKRLAKVLNTVLTAPAAIQLHMQDPVKHPPFTLDYDGVGASGDATIEAGLDSQFLRYNDKRVTDGEWKSIIPDRPEVTENDHVYDWRLGVPELMQLIAMRLTIFAAIDPNFKNNMVFQSFLSEYRDALLRHYKIMMGDTQMKGGVRCNWSLRWYAKTSYPWEPIYHVIPYKARVVCADIYTGTSASSEWLLAPQITLPIGAFGSNGSFGTSYLAACVSRHYWRTLETNNGIERYEIYETPIYQCEEELLSDEFLLSDEAWQTFMRTQIAQTEDALRRQVLLKMPLFEMRSMIDALYLYAYGGPGLPDLTEHIERITLASNPNMCLDVQWGNLAPGTPVQLWDCNDRNAQWWVYDRPSGTILNPASSRCLDVQGGNAAPGTPVQLWDCNDRNAQKWTYDPHEGVLQNALGTVLLVKGGSQKFCDHYVNGSCAGYQYYDEPINAGTPVITGMPVFPHYEGYLDRHWISEIIKRGLVPAQ